MICRSDLRTCLGAMFNRLRAGDDDMWMVVYDTNTGTYACFTVDDDDIPWDGMQEGHIRLMLCMSRLEILVLLSEPVSGMFKETRNANAAPSVPPGK